MMIQGIGLFEVLQWTRWFAVLQWTGWFDMNQWTGDLFCFNGLIVSVEWWVYDDSEDWVV